MPLFFIEMGQGIISRGDVRVRTSPIYSCTLIAGYNAGSHYGGAYHYPSDTLDDDPSVKEDMGVWVAVLRPTQLIFVHAQAMMGMGGTTWQDQLALHNWAVTTCGVVPVLNPTPVSAGMELFVGGGFNAGPTNTLVGNFNPNKTIDLSHRGAGAYLDHGRFTLIGRNREN
jgi:hypothetical protein